MKSTFVLALTLLACAGMAQENLKFKIDALADKNKQQAESERLQALFNLYADYSVQTFPEFATLIGKPANPSGWTDFSLEAIARRKKDRALFIAALQSVDTTQLTAGERMSYALLQQTLLQEKEGEQFPSELMPINQMSGYHQYLTQVVSASVVNNEQDAQNLLARLDKIPILLDQLITLMNEGIKQNVMPSATSMASVPQQIDALISLTAQKSVFLEPLQDYAAKLPKAKRDALNAAAKKSIDGRVNPALQRLKSYVEKTYIPRARPSVSWKDMPDGAAWYNREIRYHTTTHLTYDEIHAIGLSEVKRIRRAMDSLIRATGFKGSFQDFSRFLRTDPRFFYDSASQLLDAYRVIAKKIDPELPRFFGKLPRLPYGIMAVPAYEEKSQTTAYYNMGSQEAGRPGYFYANTYALRSRPTWEMEALTIHEAVPGHHLQIALAQEMENVPEFRKYIFYTAYVEGWGLYAESLGDEMGFYKDPYSKFGQLTYEMWRAVRLVVDTGIHGMGWTRQQAIDYFKANAAKTEHDITVEVDRYILWPGQALAYKIGELKIKELRARATQQLGANFDIRAFHDAILEDGAVPLDVLEQKIDRWIAARKNMK